ncbi:hypothetical protein PVBG_06046 [Plasmodium vivax Brazil I]|uniref:Uncharacterized protein n=1 Tax=Plasmodium vivax (strain Brazil I) TaxID=1033975 RepID=A0A0J9SK96_PLAV1|nr:hypothetical protein PVBG_06046 [Plasmodium vivax Brazil I]
MTEDGLKYLKDSENSMKQKIPNFTPRKDFLEWIIKHLICNRVFMHVNTNRACKYINFWLNKKVKDFNFYEYHSNFENYKEFVNTFYSVVKGDYMSYKNCADNIQILQDDEYKKMNILYTLYKKYDDLKMIHDYVYEELKTCEIIHFITKEANAIAHLYKEHNDYELIKVLRDLRDKIKNGKEKYQTLCESDLYQLDNMVTEIAFPPRKPDPPPPKEISQSTDSLERHVSGNGIQNQSEQNVDLQSSAQREQLRSEEHPTEVSHTVSSSEEPHLLDLSPTPQRLSGSYLGVSHQARSRHAENPHDYVYESSLYSSERNGLSSDARSKFIYTAHNSLGEGNTSEGVIAPEEGTQSYLQNIKGALSDTLQNIDPVPVVGVSGGMGVLFLLFKVLKFFKLIPIVYITFIYKLILLPNCFLKLIKFFF